MIASYVEEYLKPVGWLKSIETGESVDNDGPIPWYTYPMLRMLPEIVKPHHNVFEYGCGNSSVWWSRHAARVVSVEHNPEWARKVQPLCSHQIMVVEPHSDRNRQLYPELRGFHELGLEPRLTADAQKNVRAGIVIDTFESYAAELLRYPEDFFDVIVVDGMARVLTAWLASHRLRHNGFIIFDNSNRGFYQDAYDLLRTKGFRRIDFWGPAPLVAFESCTSIFTRNLAIFA